jgi:XTP/dITP diphosphohydrolase
MKLCFATNNEHKLSEVKAILNGKFQILSLKEIGCLEELPETTGTIAGNSVQKAEYVYSNYKIDCFADDSGLEVPTLDNAPGVDSAMYAGPQRSHSDNIDLLLKNLHGSRSRKARFVTIITLMASAQQFQFEGILEGSIDEEKRGANGFGYDPVFVPKGYDRTLAQMTMDQKNQISHRAKAIEKLVSFLESNYESV